MRTTSRSVLIGAQCGRNFLVDPVELRQLPGFAEIANQTRRVAENLRNAQLVGNYFAQIEAGKQATVRQRQLVPEGIRSVGHEMIQTGQPRAHVQNFGLYRGGVARYRIKVWKQPRRWRRHVVFSDSYDRTHLSPVRRLCRAQWPFGIRVIEILEN